MEWSVQCPNGSLERAWWGFLVHAAALQLSMVPLMAREKEQRGAPPGDVFIRKSLSTLLLRLPEQLMDNQ